MTFTKYTAWLYVIVACIALWTGLTQAQDAARARIIHVAAGYPALDIYINGELALVDLSYAEDSATFRLPAGEAELQANIAGTASQLILHPFSVDSAAAAIILTSKADMPLHIIADDLNPPAFGMTRLTIVNALADSAGIDLVWLRDDQLTGEAIQPGASTGALDLPASHVEFSLLPLDADDAAARHRFSAHLPAGKSNMLLIHGDSRRSAAAAFDGGRRC